MQQMDHVPVKELVLELLQVKLALKKSGAQNRETFPTNTGTVGHS